MINSKDSSADKIAQKLEDARKGMAQIHGARWPELVAEWRPQIELLMEIVKTTNPITAILPIATLMSDDGHSPLFLLAVAAEMGVEKKGEGQ